MLEVEFPVGVDAVRAAISASAVKRCTVSSGRLEEGTPEQLITVRSAAATLFPSYMLTVESERLQFLPLKRSITSLVGIRPG